MSSILQKNRFIFFKGCKDWVRLGGKGRWLSNLSNNAWLHRSHVMECELWAVLVVGDLWWLKLMQGGADHACPSQTRCDRVYSRPAVITDCDVRGGTPDSYWRFHAHPTPSHPPSSSWWPFHGGPQHTSSAGFDALDTHASTHAKQESNREKNPQSLSPPTHIESELCRQESRRRNRSKTYADRLTVRKITTIRLPRRWIATITDRLLKPVPSRYMQKDRLLYSDNPG